MSTERTTDGWPRLVLIVLAVIVLFPLVMLIVAIPMMGLMGWWWSGSMTGGLSLIWAIGMLLVWLLVLLGIGYLLYRGLAGGAGPSPTSDRALEELRVAYARGDLSEAEFEERRAKLEREESQ
ncbi:SHOCT domain-containing protein [Natrinema halophilum]|uniref:SHOCT domain-containing protein n=1 Tax=Natrinema halophilum TaxID=1699371 RepID=A0A7D5KT71_9EURY|nr:SHOCT domain-containing protein [Natrinema halophilum]QLG51057.1 SHOCT domain-containing protein [Natrinema halophilum]